MIKVFKPSGENPAVMAPEIFSGVAVSAAVLELTIKTWLGVWTVSEKTAVDPLLETANTFPVTVPSEVNALVVPPKLVGLMSWAP